MRRKMKKVALRKREEIHSCVSCYSHFIDFFVLPWAFEILEPNSAAPAVRVGVGNKGCKTSRVGGAGHF